MEHLLLRSHRIFVECQWFLAQCSDHRSDKQKVVLHRRRAVNLNGFSLGHDLARVAGGAGPSYPRDHLGWIVHAGGLRHGESHRQPVLIELVLFGVGDEMELGDIRVGQEELWAALFW